MVVFMVQGVAVVTVLSTRTVEVPLRSFWAVVFVYISSASAISRSSVSIAACPGVNPALVVTSVAVATSKETSAALISAWLRLFSAAVSAQFQQPAI